MNRYATIFSFIHLFLYLSIYLQPIPFTTYHYYSTKYSLYYELYNRCMHIGNTFKHKGIDTPNPKELRTGESSLPSPSCESLGSPNLIVVSKAQLICLSFSVRWGNSYSLSWGFIVFMYLLFRCLFKC